ncbi:MAG: hypothetical protein V3T70_04780, partial [Phycisphaerae bacterium]
MPHRKGTASNMADLDENVTVAPNDDSSHGSAGGHVRTIAVLVAIATFLVFLPSLSNGFVESWDDGSNFLNNPFYRGLGPRRLEWMFTTTHLGPYQPLSWMTLAADYLVWGEQRPFGYHLTNVILHSINAALLAAVVFGLMNLRRRSAAPCMARSQSEAIQNPDSEIQDAPHAAVAWAGVIALFWAVHPLRVEAVSWITERREVLCG